MKQILFLLPPKIGSIMIRSKYLLIAILFTIISCTKRDTIVSPPISVEVADSSVATFLFNTMMNSELENNVEHRRAYFIGTARPTDVDTLTDKEVQIQFTLYGWTNGVQTIIDRHNATFTSDTYGAYQSDHQHLTYFIKDTLHAIVNRGYGTYFFWQSKFYDDNWIIYQYEMVIIRSNRVVSSRATTIP